MRWNLLWFIPLGILFCSYFLWRNITNGFELLKLLKERWSWGVLLSPSAIVFLGVLSYSLVYPIQSLILIRSFFDPDSPAYRRRYLYAIVASVGTFVLAAILEAIIWGSFPLEIDSAGVGHLRMIPFLPWPDRAYGSY